MTSNMHELKAVLVEKFLAMVDDRLDKAVAISVKAFAGQFYERLAPVDILEMTAEDLYGATLSIYKFSQSRKSDQMKLRAFRPSMEEHGWTTAHTVIEIVNDDMPFLVDSVTAALNRRGLTVHQIIHPVMIVKRSAAGERTALEGSSDKLPKGCMRESYMHLEIDEQSDPKALAQIEADIGEALHDVRSSVADWRTMLNKVQEIIKSLDSSKSPLEKEEVSEAAELLKWMASNHFTFLGYREYNFNKAGKSKSETLSVVDNSGLGILRDPARRIMSGSNEMSPEVRAFLNRPEQIIVTKANVRSTVHRAVHLDYVGVKKFNAKGQVIGEYRFTGLFTSAAYNRIPSDIPYLRRKVARTLAAANLNESSHDAKALEHILESYPRDELFQISEEELFEIAAKILVLQERPRICGFLRRDRFERFVSALVYVPREKFNTELRRRFGTIIEELHGGHVSSHNILVGDESLARIHYIIALHEGEKPVVDEALLEAKLVAAAREWADDLYDALVDQWGEEKSLKMNAIYGEAFPAGYKDKFGAKLALLDIEKMEKIRRSGQIGLNFYRLLEDADHMARFKIFNPGSSLPLSDCLPMMENMGLKVMSENPYSINLAGDGETIWIHDFELVEPAGKELDVQSLKTRFEDTFLNVWRGIVESDGFNKLVLQADLDWTDVVILRAYSKYLRQAGITFSQDYMEATLSANATITRLLCELFKARFDPARDKARAQTEAVITDKLLGELDQVASLDEDRILRRFVNLIENTLRTNFYQPDADGNRKTYVSLKLDSQKVDELPLPRPHVEIFVYSRRVEGVHLRGGTVARGGLRWSDRREDFRTEVLGLMKAQMVKNTVIVPVGSKGGFVPKQLPVGGSRDEIQQEGIACYKIFISALLDVTDNLVSAQVVPPDHVVRHDEDDPYLVVAADKGTATFSDIANDVAISYGFWLGDAFASGGAVGYDHKKMAITARGAWESVKRHFREIGLDTQSQDFTVAGIGDMSGDVFGNGMLLSEHIKLVAAFDHRNFFLDPNPDIAASFKERQRIFELPRSSWEDYDTKLISKGGGIYDRGAKSIKLSPEMMKILGLETNTVTPNKLMTAILSAEVDLLWFGGIGTYIKSSDESHLDVGDRANDAIRVNGSSVRAKVIGEGGNLGVTQRGRIEYGMSGGRLNTDAIDNSAGVDCSDHEVNIKILLQAIMDDGEMTAKQRNRLLVEMTDAVADHVLKDNYLQTQALTTLQRQGIAGFEEHIRFIRALEKQGRLDRAVEYLPDDEGLAEREAEGKGLSRPELSVLLAYSKLTLYPDILETDLPGDPYLQDTLVNYFPSHMRKKYAKTIQTHQLRREIITTVVVNSLINRAGPTFVPQLVEELGVAVDDVARAYLVVCDVFDLRTLWAEIEALDNKVSTDIQGRMIDAAQRLVRRGTLWCLRHLPYPIAIADHIKTLGADMRKLESNLDGLLSDAGRRTFEDRATYLTEMSVPEDLARRIAALGPLRSSLDVVQVGRNSSRPVDEAAEVYFAVGAQLNLDWLRWAAENIETHNHWERLAVTAIIDDLYGQQRALTNVVFASAGKNKGVAAFDLWADGNRRTIDRSKTLIEEFKSSGGVDISKLAFANRQFRSMIS